MTLKGYEMKITHAKMAAHRSAIPNGVICPSPHAAALEPVSAIREKYKG
jgi:hypothetical protein